MSNKEPNRPKARLPRGFADSRAEEIRERNAMLASIQEVYERYGFEPLETPAFEYTEALGKFLPDQDRPNEGVFSLQDDDEQWLSLRYDLTAPLARFVAENFNVLPKPFRRYQYGPVWRNEKPGPGRYRQFYQFDVDTIGTPTMAADAELAMVLCDALEALGIKRGAYRVRINNRKVLNGVLESIGVLRSDGEDDEKTAAKRMAVLRAIDKLDRLGREGVRHLLGPGRKDESGDFTKGAELSREQVETVIAFTEAGDPSRARVTERLSDLVKQSNFGASGVRELEEMGAYLDAADFCEDRVMFDPSVVRGLAYYTGPVIEAELLEEITNEHGQRVQIGSVAGGGRYDDLVARFTGQTVPATGVSIGVSRLQAALAVLNGQSATAHGPVVVLLLDQSHAGDYQRLVTELRGAGIRSELYLGGSGMRAQLKYADRRRSPIAVIEGDDERAKGEVTLKDLLQGAEMARTIESNEAWRREQPAQISVPRSKLVVSVRAMLERQRARG